MRDDNAGKFVSEENKGLVTNEHELYFTNPFLFSFFAGSIQ